MSGIWVALALGLWWESPHDIGWYGSHLTAWLELEDPLQGWLIHVTAGRKLSSTPCGHLCKPAWMSSWHGNCLPPEQLIKESKVEVGNVSHDILRSHLSLHNILVTQANPIQCGRELPKGVPESGEHWGPSWSLGSRLYPLSSFLFHERWPKLTAT